MTQGPVDSQEPQDLSELNATQLSQLGYQVKIRIIRGREVKRVGLEELQQLGISQERLEELHDMYTVVVDDKPAVENDVMLLIPTIEKRSAAEQQLQLLQQQKKMLQERDTALEEEMNMLRQRIKEERALVETPEQNANGGLARTG